MQFEAIIVDFDEPRKEILLLFLPESNSFGYAVAGLGSP